jgi:hypothetical protein
MGHGEGYRLSFDVHSAVTLLEAPREEARGAAKAFLRLLAPFVRRLIEGVY